MLAKFWKSGASVKTKSELKALSRISPRSCWRTQPVKLAYRTWARPKTPDPRAPSLDGSAKLHKI